MFVTNRPIITMRCVAWYNIDMRCGSHLQSRLEVEIMRPHIVLIACLLCLFWGTVTNLAAAESVGANLIANSSLENVVSGKPVDIDFTFQEGKPSIEVDNSVAHLGTKSIKITCTGADRGAIGRRIALQGGKTYRFSAWYKTTPGTEPADITLRLMFSKSSSSWGESDKVPLSQEMLVDPTEGSFRFGANTHIDGQIDAAQEWQRSHEGSAGDVRLDWLHQRGDQGYHPEDVQAHGIGANTAAEAA
jgi:hypothetical protein